MYEAKENRVKSHSWPGFYGKDQPLRHGNRVVRNDSRRKCQGMSPRPARNGAEKGGRISRPGPCVGGRVCSGAGGVGSEATRKIFCGGQMSVYTQI